MAGLKSALVALGAVGLTACGPAEANDSKKAPETAEFTKAEVVKVATATKTRTLLDCLKMENQLEKSACKIEVKAQREAEIAALDIEEKSLNDENATLDTKIAEGNTTNEGLRNEVEGLKKVVAMQEEPTE